MSEQKSFPGFDLPPKPTDRLFFAILPEPSVANRIVEFTQTLRLKYGLHGAPLPAAQLHISLFNLGDYVGLPQNLLAAATSAVSRITQDAFAVRFDHVLTFRYPSSAGYPLVLSGEDGVSGVKTLHQDVTDTLSRIGLRGESSFTPHLTLLYDNQKILKQAVDPFEWEVREFVLLQRHIGQRRPYSVLGKWPLRDPKSGVI
jgi:2'-5' RNA ligase